MPGNPQALGVGQRWTTVYGQESYPLLGLPSIRSRTALTLCTPGLGNRQCTRPSQTPADRSAEAEKDSTLTAPRERSVLLPAPELPDRNRRAVFPVGRGAGPVAKQLADHAELRHGVRAFLVLPLVVASTGQRFCLLRRWRLAVHNKSCQLVRTQFLPIYCPSRLSSRTQMFRKRTG